MSTSELIEKEVNKLPEPLQREVYDFAASCDSRLTRNNSTACS